jgi:proteasome maturation protein
MAFNVAMRPDLEGMQEIQLPEGSLGVPDRMLYGFPKARDGNAKVHPLEHSEKYWNENKLKMDLSMLRNLQGLHAPLKLQMEHNITKKMRRLPGLPSSNILEDSLSGRDELIDFDDIFNAPEERETNMQPHLQIEKQLNLL